MANWIKQASLLGFALVLSGASAFAQSPTPAEPKPSATALPDQPAETPLAVLDLISPIPSPPNGQGYQAATLDFAALLASLAPPVPRSNEGAPTTGASGDAAKAVALAAALPLDLRYVGADGGGLTALAALSPQALAPARADSQAAKPVFVQPLVAGPQRSLPPLPKGLVRSLAARSPGPARMPQIGDVAAGTPIQSAALPPVASLPSGSRGGSMGGPEVSLEGGVAPSLHAQPAIRLATLAVRLNQHEAALSDARQQVASLSLDKQAIRRQLTATEQERQQLADRLKQNQIRIDLELLPELQATRDGLLRLGQEHQALLASQQQLEQALAQAQTRIQGELEPKIKKLLDREGTQVSALFDELDLLRFERDAALLRAQVVNQAYQQTADTFDAELGAQVAALQAQIVSFSGERDGLVQQVHSLNESIKSHYEPMLHDLERDNIDLQNRNTKLTNRIERLQSQLASSEAQAAAVQGRVDPQACEQFVDQQADMLAAMGSLQQLFQLDQVTPKDLRPVDGSAVDGSGADGQAATAFDFVFNDLIAGWLLERRIDPFTSPDQQKLALLNGKKKKARWTPESSEQVLALQAASNDWLKKKGLRLPALGIPAAKGCGGRLCLTGLVDRRTRMVAGYIFDRDPSVFPGAAKALSQSQGSQDAASRVQHRRRSSLRLGSDVVVKLRDACRGQG